MPNISFENKVLAITPKTTAWKVSKYGVISGLYFPVFGLNEGKYKPEIIPYLDTSDAVQFFLISLLSFAYATIKICMWCFARFGTICTI